MFLSEYRIKYIYDFIVDTYTLNQEPCAGLRYLYLSIKQIFDNEDGRSVLPGRRQVHSKYRL